MKEQSWETNMHYWFIVLDTVFLREKEIKSIVTTRIGQRLLVRILEEATEHLLISQVTYMLIGAAAYGMQIPNLSPKFQFLHEGRI